jgi:hypothetical protein
MRWAVLCFLVACSSLRAGGSNQCSGDPPPGSCSCVEGQWWCSDCPFFEGEGPVACSSPGATCDLETWEHGCSCSCGSDGWWGCFEETIGSRCPKPPSIIDAGIDGPPDAIPIDAAACSRLEAENIGIHPDWSYLYGSDLGGGLGLTTGRQTPLVLNFTGTTFAIRHEIGPNLTPMEVSIDGAAPVVISSYQASTFTMVTSPVASGLANIEHHVSIVCEGNDCNVDYFDVTCN